MTCHNTFDVKITKYLKVNRLTPPLCLISASCNNPFNLQNKINFPFVSYIFMYSPTIKLKQFSLQKNLSLKYNSCILLTFVYNKKTRNNNAFFRSTLHRCRSPFFKKKKKTFLHHKNRPIMPFFLTIITPLYEF